MDVVVITPRSHLRQPIRGAGRAETEVASRKIEHPRGWSGRVEAAVAGIHSRELGAEGWIGNVQH